MSHSINPPSIIKNLIRPLVLSVGELLAGVSRISGRFAARMLFTGQWRLATPEWFDRRLMLLDSERWFYDLLPVCYSNSLEVLPLGGKILDLCGGDGWASYYFYSRRADTVISIDNNLSAYERAISIHSRKNISYIHGDVLAYEHDPDFFDVVHIRGAIEHFSQENQQKIFCLAHQLLKPGGYFCGDTPANKKSDSKMLSSHENEWESEHEMRQELCRVFKKVETWTFLSREPNSPEHVRTSLMWRCQKEI